MAVARTAGFKTNQGCGASKAGRAESGLGQFFPLQFFKQVITGAHSNGHHGERGVLTSRRTETGTVGDKQILNVMRLIVVVKDRGLGIEAHASSSYFVDRHTWLLN